MAATKPYDWTQFTLKIDIKASPEKVFKAWTDDKQIVKWFPVNSVVEPKKGGRFFLEWLGDIKLDTTISKIRKPTMVEFPFGTKGELVRVTIRKVRDGSICEIHQFNMKTGPKDRVNMHMGCRTGWAFFLANLKSYLEKGPDLRSNDPKRSWKQDFVNS